MARTGNNAQRGAETGEISPGTKVGSETVAVPAGSFECDHYRKLDERGAVDLWLSSKVSPYGTVKMFRRREAIRSVSS